MKLINLLPIILAVTLFSCEEEIPTPVNEDTSTRPRANSSEPVTEVTSDSTLFNYPETTDYGKNILSGDDSIVLAYTFDTYSMSVENTSNSSLKIELKEISGTSFEQCLWGYSMAPAGPINWKILSYDEESHSQVFKVIDTDKENDISIVFQAIDTAIIEVLYYENSDETPSYKKRIRIIGQ